MGSKSDWETLRPADEMLTRLGIPHECHVVSAHRTPAWMAEFAAGAEGRGIAVIIAGAGGAAHLPGMVAAQTLVPVLGVPVGTLAIGKAGAANAALLAARILAVTRPALRETLRALVDEETRRVRAETLP
jgi:5-(carboxyamino)imidazole ribonucleotide mutase